MNVQSATKASGAANPLTGYKVIDVDTHWSEPPDLWTSRAPAKFKDIVPQIHDKDGERWWFIDGKPFGKVQHASSIRKGGEKVLGMGFYGLAYDEIEPGSHSVEPRLAAMDTAGIHAQIVYPNLLGFGNTKASGFSPDARLVSSQIYNDAGAEMQEASGNRIFPMILVPWWDIDDAVKEIRRCHAMGMRGINTNADPQEAGMPDLGQDYWNPLWEVCTELDMPINFHIGASQSQNMWFGEAPWGSLRPDAKLIVGGKMLIAGIMKTLANIVMSGLLEKYPKLKFVSVESGIGWLPFTMDSLDYSVTQVPASGIDHLTMLPSEYIRRNFSACFWFEKVGVRNIIDRIGIDNVMWETDYPHPTCLFPDALAVAAESLADFDKAEKQQILGGNASRIYNIPLD